MIIPWVFPLYCDAPMWHPFSNLLSHPMRHLSSTLLWHPYVNTFWTLLWHPYVNTFSTLLLTPYGTPCFRVPGFRVPCFWVPGLWVPCFLGTRFLVGGKVEIFWVWFYSRFGLCIVELVYLPSGAASVWRIAETWALKDSVLLKIDFSTPKTLRNFRGSEKFWTPFLLQMSAYGP